MVWCSLSLSARVIVGARRVIVGAAVFIGILLYISYEGKVALLLPSASASAIILLRLFRLPFVFLRNCWVLDMIVSFDAELIDVSGGGGVSFVAVLDVVIVVFDGKEGDGVAEFGISNGERSIKG